MSDRERTLELRIARLQLVDARLHVRGSWARGVTRVWRLQGRWRRHWRDSPLGRQRALLHLSQLLLQCAHSLLLDCVSPPIHLQLSLELLLVGVRARHGRRFTAPQLAQRLTARLARAAHRRL